MMRCIEYPTMLKDGSGWGAFVGVSAAYLAQDGFTGAPAITVEAPEQGDLWSDLGSRWRITEQYLKPWPVCRWAQPAIEAAAGLIAAYGLRPGDIATVEVETFAAGVSLGTAPPRDTEAAQYALGFPLAAFLARGSLASDAIAQSGIDDPAVGEMLTKISLRERPEFTAAFPGTREAVVHVTRRDGTAITSPVTRARGDTNNPLSDNEVLAKFGELMRPVGTLRTTSIAALIGADASSLNVPSLLDLVTAPLPMPPERAVA
jgi:2-methylcitrate dehydratase PrpD